MTAFPEELETKLVTSIFAMALLGFTVIAAAPSAELSPDGLSPLRLGMTQK